jgi:hypothetical protein
MGLTENPKAKIQSSNQRINFKCHIAPASAIWALTFELGLNVELWILSLHRA